jgi:hypothetical protein
MNHSQNVRFNWNRISILMEGDVIILSSSVELALDGSLRVNFFLICSQFTEEYGTRNVHQVQKALIGASKNCFYVASHRLPRSNGFEKAPSILP